MTSSRRALRVRAAWDGFQTVGQGEAEPVGESHRLARRCLRLRLRGDAWPYVGRVLRALGRSKRGQRSVFPHGCGRRGAALCYPAITCVSRLWVAPPAQCPAGKGRAPRGLTARWANAGVGAGPIVPGRLVRVRPSRSAVALGRHRRVGAGKYFVDPRVDEEVYRDPAWSGQSLPSRDQALP